jgi:ADP-ribose pyrophosphatase
MTTDDIKRWKQISRNKIFSNPYGYEIYQDDVLTPYGKPGKYTVIKQINGGFVAVVALTKNLEIVLVRHHRYATDRIYTEIPAGNIEKGEDPFHAGRRELLQETGFSTNNLTMLIIYDAVNGICAVTGHILLALEVFRIQDPQPEADELHQIVIMPFQEYKNFLRYSSEPKDERSLLGIYEASERLDL